MDEPSFGAVGGGTGGGKTVSTVSIGAEVGPGEGEDDGLEEGDADRAALGLLLGDKDCAAEDETEGLLEGDGVEDAGLGLLVGAIVIMILGESVIAAVGALDIREGAPVASSITLKASKSGSWIKVHFPPQQKHWSVTVFQLKKNGADSFPLLEQ